MIAPRVSTWITFAEGKDGVFKDIRTERTIRPGSFINELKGPNVRYPRAIRKYRNGSTCGRKYLPVRFC